MFSFLSRLMAYGIEIDDFTLRILKRGVGDTLSCNTKDLNIQSNSFKSSLTLLSIMKHL